MTTDAVFTRPTHAEPSSRQITLRTRGHSHGSLTRLVSPGDIGEQIKPFVFLDYFEADPATAPKFGFHPHSGIATLTLILSGQDEGKCRDSRMRMKAELWCRRRIGFEVVEKHERLDLFADVTRADQPGEATVRVSTRAKGDLS